jgi:putative transposase
MGNLDYKAFTERRRPHIDPPDASLFVTFRLANSIPKAVVREHKAKKSWLKGQLAEAIRIAEILPSPTVDDWVSRIDSYYREWFIRSEEILHRAAVGPTWLKEPGVAAKVVENLHRLDGEDFRLDAFSVMSNHVHVVFKSFLSASDLYLKAVELSDNPGMSKIMHSLKGRSARECNLLLGRTGSFWEHESFDRVIRAGRFGKTIRYVLNNPVKAGLVGHWTEWPWNYCRKELVDDFAPHVEEGRRLG